MTSFFRPFQVFSDVGRLQKIAVVLIRHGFGELLGRLHLQDNLFLRLFTRNREIEKLSPPQRVAMVLQELGPTFIKLGQILSTRPDLIPPEYIEELKKLQSEATPISFQEVKEQIESALKKPLDKLFAEFDEKPMASASIAQVHAAKLHTGEEVVVKVQRPGIAQIIRSDLSLLKMLARRVVQFFPEFDVFDPISIVEEFERAITKELDFLIEARHIQRFINNFAGNPEVHIPRVYRELTCETVLTMERIYGVKITEVNYNQKVLVRRLLRIVFEMIYEHGFFHGDLHPGNILVEKDGRIALLDFGLVGRLTPQMRDNITDLLVGLIYSDYQKVADILYEIGIKRTPVNYDRFLADVTTVMDENIVGLKLSEIEFGKLFQELVLGAKRHNISIPPDYTMLFKALMTVEGVGKQLDPDLDLLSELEPYVGSLIRERYSPKKLLQKGYQNINDFVRLWRQFPITARQFLMAIENGRLHFGLDPGQLERVSSDYSYQMNRKIEAILSAGLLLAASLSIDYGLPTFFGLPFHSFLGYTVGGFLTLHLLYTLFFKR